MLAQGLSVAYRKAHPIKPQTDPLLTAVVTACNITEQEFTGTSKKHHIALARQIYAWFSKNLIGQRLETIATNLHRDRTTIYYAIDKIEGYVSIQDRTICNIIRNIQQQLA